MTDPVIAVVNKSTVVPAPALGSMAAAVSLQIRHDVAPAWGRRPMAVKVFTDEAAAPPDAYVIAVFDDSDQAGALGWHTESPQGQVYGKVFAKPVLDNGGDLLHSALSVASVLSHEAVEAFCDPSVSLWGMGPKSTLYAYEACDPVESDSYASGGVTVSDFVLPAWFDPQAQGRVDFLGRLTAPFTIAKGGYVVYMRGGVEHQRFAEEYPEWRRALKGFPAARTARRQAQAS